MSLVDRSDSVLVVVDTQPGFVRADSRTSAEAQEAAETVERIAWLVTVARTLEIPAVVVEEGADRNGSTDPAVLERFSREVELLAKTTFGLAESGAIVDALRGKSRGTIVLTGFDTDVCVAQSALGLQREGFRPIVVEDAVYSSRAIHHRRGLGRVRQAGIEVNHCRGLACEWIREVELADQVVEETRKFGKAPLVPRAYGQAGPGSE